MIEKPRTYYAKLLVQRFQVRMESHSRGPMVELVGVGEEPPDIFKVFRLRHFGSDAVHMMQAQRLVVAFRGI
jgi:hypothetical protein